MTDDPYRISSEPAAAPAPKPRPGRALRVILWPLLVACISANAVANFSGHTVIALGFGLVSVACIAGLIALYLRGRRG